MNLDEISKKSIMLSNLINKMPSFVKDHCLIVKFKKGETILEKGEDANKVYIFCTGEIEVKNYFSNGRNYIFSRSKAEKNYFGNIPDFLGSIAIIGEKEKFVSTVIAYKDCITIKISKKFFFAWLRKDVNLCLDVAKVIAVQHYESSENFGSTSAYSVKYLFINYLIERYHSTDSKGLFILKDNRKKIADYICTTERTLNRAINSLKSNDYISVFKGKICIDESNFKKLQELLQSLSN